MGRIQFFDSPQEALSDLGDGAVIMIGGFYIGRPDGLVASLLSRGARELTIIANAPGGLLSLVEKGQMRRFIGSFPALTSQPGNIFEQAYLRGELEVEMVPQGTLAERIRAGGAGLGGFYTPTGVGTVVEEGKERRLIRGREYILELPLRADYAFIRAYKADGMGNLIYRRAERNFNPAMATAARITIAEVDAVVAVGELDSEAIVTPGIYVDRVVLAAKEGKDARRAER